MRRKNLVFGYREFVLACDKFLKTLTQLNQFAYILTYFCVQGIFGAPTSNEFPTSPKIDFKTNLAIDVPKGVKLPKKIKFFANFVRSFA